jgi:hypothetical protein
MCRPRRYRNRRCGAGVEAPEVEVVQGAIVKKFKFDPRCTRVEETNGRQGLVVLEESGARVEAGRSLHILISGI